MVIKFFIWFFLTIIILDGVFALTETLIVETCSGGLQCSVSNYNSNSSANTGHTIRKQQTGTTTWSDSAVTGADTIDLVRYRIRHSGDSGIDGSWTITFSDVSQSTTYCTDTTIPHVSTDTYITIDPSSCGWTAGRLDDLLISLSSGDGSSPDNGYVYYADVYIEYTQPGSDDLNGTLKMTRNVPSSRIITQNTTFDINGSVECQGAGDCYEVNLSVYFNMSGLKVDTRINNTLNAKPLYNISYPNNFFINKTCGYMNVDDKCSFNISVNATGIGKQIMLINFSVNATTNNSFVSGNSTESFTVNIDPELRTSITACQTITNPGLYKVTQALTAAASSHCIIVQASDVDLDCKNYRINTVTAAYSAIVSDIGNINNFFMSNCRIDCIGRDGGCLRLSGINVTSFVDGTINTTGVAGSAESLSVNNVNNLSIRRSEIVHNGNCLSCYNTLFDGRTNFTFIEKSLIISKQTSDNSQFGLTLFGWSYGGRAENVNISGSKSSGSETDAVVVSGATAIANWTFESVNITSFGSNANSYGVRLEGNPRQNFFINSTIRTVGNAAAKEIFIKDNGNINYLINTSIASGLGSNGFGVQAGSTSKVYNMYFIRVNVTNAAGEPLGSAEVNISSEVRRENNTVNDVRDTSQSNGWTERFNLTDFMINGTYNNFRYLQFNNHTINVSLSGYVSQNDIPLNVSRGTQEIIVALNVAPQDISFTISYPASGCSPGFGCYDTGCTSCIYCTVNFTSPDQTYQNCTAQTDENSFFLYQNTGDVNIDLEWLLNDTVTSFLSLYWDTDGNPVGSTIVPDPPSITTVAAALAPTGQEEIWTYGGVSNGIEGNISRNITVTSSES